MEGTPTGSVAKGGLDLVNSLRRPLQQKRLWSLKTQPTAWLLTFGLLRAELLPSLHGKNKRDPGLEQKKKICALSDK